MRFVLPSKVKFISQCVGDDRIRIKIRTLDFRNRFPLLQGVYWMSRHCKFPINDRRNLDAPSFKVKLKFDVWGWNSNIGQHCLVAARASIWTRWFQRRFRDIDVTSRAIFMIMKSKCTIVDKDISYFRAAVWLLSSIYWTRFHEFWPLNSQ